MVLVSNLFIVDFFLLFWFFGREGIKLECLLCNISFYYWLLWGIYLFSWLNWKFDRDIFQTELRSWQLVILGLTVAGKKGHFWSSVLEVLCFSIVFCETKKKNLIVINTTKMTTKSILTLLFRAWLFFLIPTWNLIMFPLYNQQIWKADLIYGGWLRGCCFFSWGWSVIQ